MSPRTLESWHCTNHACKAEALLENEARTGGENPRCGCGAPMKKKYSSPVFSYLDFLRLDDLVEVADGAQKAAEE